MRIKGLVAGIVLFGTPAFVSAQTAFGDRLEVVTSAVPVLAIGPDARHGGMANTGAASSVDANATFWNIAKLAFLEEGETEVALNYTPWLNRLVPDIDLSYVSFVTAIDENQSIGASIRYFSLGDITFRNQQGAFQGTFNPYEMSADVGYALKLSEYWSAGIALRYIFSDLTQGQAAGIRPGQSVSTDVSAYYRGPEMNLGDGQRGRLLFGGNISNVGAKISYSDGGREDFLPTNMRLGFGYELQIDQYNSITFLADVNRLLVPTAPVKDDQGNILEGEDDNVGVIPGILQSLDPGAKPDGWDEFWRENMYNVAAEYWYDGIFAVRGGYQHETQSKGNRKYFTMGVGIRYSQFGFDFSYLIPANTTVRSPLENTLRLSLMMSF
ncbi:MAG: type IX secretion system outer membrane channel protein PorV [Flavobacteriia bacterium]|nr:type IX secretion system outer membrane channel protein PorV [Flavobacteriia bacterium]